MMMSPVLFYIMLQIVTVLDNADGAALQNPVTGRNNSVTLKRKARNVVKYDDMLWPDGRVPYAFVYEFSSSEIQMLEKAMREIERLTCIRFVRKSDNDKDYINFDTGDRCASDVGRIGGAQGIILASGCFNSLLTLLHELMHAIGFYHEQNRQGRDDYITINWNNIREDKRRGYEMQDTKNLAPFDFDSIMLYGEYDFSKNGGKTMERKDRSKAIKGIHSQWGLSSTDVFEVNELYKCNIHVHPKKWVRTYREVYRFMIDRLRWQMVSHGEKLTTPQWRRGIIRALKTGILIIFPDFW